MSMSVHSSYLPKVFEPHERTILVEKCVRHLRDLIFDSIAVRGVSGMSIGAVVAHILNKGLIVIRKPDDSHSTYPVEGAISKKYIVLDDFMSTGKTLNLILSSLETEGRFGECVGVFFYDRDPYTADKLEKLRKLKVKLIRGEREPETYL